MKETKESILQSIRDKIAKKCAIEYKKLEKEKDEVKQLRRVQKIQAKSLSIILNEIKNFSNKQWDQCAEELYEPIVKQSMTVSDAVDTLVLKKSKDAKEYKKYEKMKKIVIASEKESLDIFTKAKLNKKQLERFLVLILNQMYKQNISITETNLNWIEFLEAIPIVQRRLGFDQNWLACLSLVQLHENLIKKKIDELKGQIDKDESIRSLISKLSNLIKEKEKREVSLALLLSNNIKIARDTMSHEGYKHSVSKQDLENIFTEIVKLERTLYHEK